ncbi:Atp-Binding Cassette Sub-Family A Member 6 [Manis pentadactyla]|nr:Atp-Binding Cassette Sub-Family A Member 6 [Manis pentadactyla]
MAHFRSMSKPPGSRQPQHDSWPLFASTRLLQTSQASQRGEANCPVAVISEMCSAEHPEDQYFFHFPDMAMSLETAR